MIKCSYVAECTRHSDNTKTFYKTGTLLTEKAMDDNQIRSVLIAEMKHLDIKVQKVLSWKIIN